MGFGKLFLVWGFFLSIATAELTATVVMAGDQKGDGGGGVVCRSSDGTIISAQALDIFEGEKRDMTFDFGPEESDPSKIVNVFIDRIATFDPVAAEQYRELALEFFDEGARKFTDGPLPFSEDTGTIFPPNGCKYEQIILQMLPRTSLDHLYTLSSELWGELKNKPKDQAALAFHEILYRDYLRKMDAFAGTYGGGVEELNSRSYVVENSSFWVRIRVQKIMSANWRELTSYDYLKLFYYAFIDDFIPGTYFFPRSLIVNGRTYSFFKDAFEEDKGISDFKVRVKTPLVERNLKLFLKSPANGSVPWKLGSVKCGGDICDEANPPNFEFLTGDGFDISSLTAVDGVLEIGPNTFESDIKLDKTDDGYLLKTKPNSLHGGRFKFVKDGQVHEVPPGEDRACHKATFDDKGNILTFDDLPCE